MPTQAEATSPRRVPCPKCGAPAGERCHVEDGAILLGHHDDRRKLAAKLPALPFSDTLDATDKSLIVYYAYVMLSDAVSTNAEAMGLGKQTSEEVQRFFAQKAVAELRKDGLLK